MQFFYLYYELLVGVDTTYTFVFYSESRWHCVLTLAFNMFKDQLISRLWETFDTEGFPEVGLGI